MGGTVGIWFVRAALDLARARELDVGQTLADADIPAELVDENGARVTETQAARLVQSLWSASDDELLGVGARPVPRGTFRMMTLGLIHAPELDTALLRLVEFVRIGMGFEAVEFLVDGRGATLSFGSRDTDQTDQQITAIFMAVVHRFVGWLIGQPISLRSVDLPGKVPPHTTGYQRIYGVVPRFQTMTAAITFDSRHLRSPLAQNEAGLTALIRSSPNALLCRPDSRPTTPGRVRAILEHSGAPGAVTVEDAAKSLHISAQHLRRLLRDEGSSFRHIKENVLRDEAVASLVRGRETIQALSARLGFSEPSAFRRAFRRWTGSPPGSYRPSLSD